MQKRILVVGEDPVLVEELRSEGRTEGSGWLFHCVQCGSDALAALKQAEHTAVVANWLLPGGMSGTALLDEVLRQQPNCLRFIRTDVYDQEGTTKCVGSVHRLLIHPTEVQTLKNAVMSALELEAWLPSDKVRVLLRGLQRLPSPPALYFEVVSQLESPHASLDDICETISRDPAITGKLLQLVNSAVFALQLRVNHPSEAIGYLGLETTKSLVLLAHIFSHFDDLVTPGFSIDSLWQHSFDTARQAQRIARSEANDPEVAAQSFTAGLLHDIGKLVLAANQSARFQQAVHHAVAEDIELWQAERELLGTHHAEVGGCLLAIWGLPIPIVQAVGLHHCPVCLAAPEFTPLVAVHVANVLTQSTDRNGRHAALPTLDLNFLHHANCADRVADWMQFAPEGRDLIQNAVGL